jgi:hypothetical protein
MQTINKLKNLHSIILLKQKYLVKPISDHRRILIVGFIIKTDLLKNEGVQIKKDNKICMTTFLGTSYAESAQPSAHNPYEA